MFTLHTVKQVSANTCIPGICTQRCMTGEREARWMMHGHWPPVMGNRYFESSLTTVVNYYLKSSYNY